MFLYTADTFTGEMIEWDEGELKFIKKSELDNLYFWEGDRIFLRLISENHPFFDLKLVYEGKKLVKAILDGEVIENERI